MKKSIIKDIFFGNRVYSSTLKASQKYRNILSESTKLSSILRKTLLIKQKEIFDKLELMDTTLEEETALTYFTEGFKIGLTLGIECMDDK